jgi:signal transduction histidine kinase
MGNEQLIKTALVNLIDNGCKYSAKHRIHVNIYPAEQQVRLNFLDRGVGIVPADLPHIFEPFYRGKNTGSVRGHGIGLSLVERIIRLHRGRIQVFSELGKGTTFEVAFPIHHF